MQRLIALLILAALALLGAPASSAGQLVARPLATPAATARYVPDEVLVAFAPQASATAQASVLASFGDLALQRAVGSQGYALVKLQAGRTLDSAMNAYAAMPGVQSVQPNYVYEFFAVPNDPHYVQLWGLRNNGQTIAGGTSANAVPGADMDMEQAWDQITDCRAATVAVLDSGVNYTHEDLAGNMWDGAAAGFPHHGFDFADNDNDPLPRDALGHGNHVAATVGAVGNNGIGVTGVCWRARLMALRVGGRSGPTTARIIQGVQFAVAHGAKVINMSFGGAIRDAALEAEIAAARERGVVVIVAAGNGGSDNDSGTTPIYPCNFPLDNIVCVAALDQGYNKAAFSNFGATSVDVGAPGTNILSAWPGTAVADDFTDWTLNGGWSQTRCNFAAGPLPILANPGSWCATTPGQYGNDANDVAYKNFDLSGGVLHAQVNFSRFLETEPDGDFLGFARSASGGDPFAAGTLIREVSGSNGQVPVAESLDLNDCLSVTCTFGFRLRSNGSAADFGVAIALFQIETVQSGSRAYQLLNGTSMAAPHAAGVAAMLWAYNPAYTYADVVRALKEGGDSVAALAGITATGRAANAAGSLRYISPPTGVTATVAAAPQ